MLKKVTLIIIILNTFSLKVFAMDDKKVILGSLKKAQEWLLSQQTPNNVVKDSKRPGFILSYEHTPGKDGYKYIFSKSSIYDNALAVIAFTMLGNDVAAMKILKSVMETSPTGLLYFNYNTHNHWPNDKDRNGAVVRNGASAWFGYAVAFYLKIQIKKNPKYLISSQGKDLQNYLKKIINQILKFKIVDKLDPRHGLITGGHGKHKLKLVKNKPIEEFTDEKIDWVSIEHCMDLYFLLHEAHLLKISDYDKTYKLLKEKLVPMFWNEEINQFNRGYGINGKDPVEALDAASWGAMYLYSIGDIEKSIKALRKAEAYINWNDPLKGHRPYINVKVFEDWTMNEFYYPSDKAKSWGGIDISWYEGTFGVYLAQLKVKGQTKKMRDLLFSILKGQKDNGSFVYATREIPFQFSKEPSVASTAWFVILASSYIVPEFRQEFWP
jgi:hypothetical protein